MKAKVVSDTGPLNYLVLIGCEEILPKLYGEVFIPVKVLEELRHEKTPVAARRWALNLPEWVCVQAVEEVSRFPNLDAGQADALALALGVGSGFILMDDSAARLTAEKLGLVPIGTLGLLLAADRAGLVNFDEALCKLRVTNFRMSAELLKAIQSKRKARQEDH